MKPACHSKRAPGGIKLLPVGLKIAASLVFSVALAAPAFGQSPALEARFNNTDNMDLQNGAALGPNGSGVSGKTDDRSYAAEASNWIAGNKGPAVRLAGGTPVEGVEELTITAWYKPRANVQQDVMLFSAAGTGLIWDLKTSQWTLRIDAVPKDVTHRIYWFTSGNKPPMGTWTNTNEWTFLAMVWTSADKKVTFYQGGGTKAAEMAREATRPETVEPLSERPGTNRIIGNRDKEMDRPFDGNIDNVRFYPKALDAAAVEKIRQADLANESVSLP